MSKYIFIFLLIGVACGLGWYMLNPQRPVLEQSVASAPPSTAHTNPSMHDEPAATLPADDEPQPSTAQPVGRTTKKPPRVDFTEQFLARAVPEISEVSLGTPKGKVEYEKRMREREHMRQDALNEIADESFAESIAKLLETNLHELFAGPPLAFSMHTEEDRQAIAFHDPRVARLIFEGINGEDSTRQNILASAIDMVEELTRMRLSDGPSGSYGGNSLPAIVAALDYEGESLAVLAKLFDAEYRFANLGPPALPEGLLETYPDVEVYHITQDMGVVAGAMATIMLRDPGYQEQIEPLLVDLDDLPVRQVFRPLPQASITEWNLAGFEYIEFRAYPNMAAIVDLYKNSENL